MTIEKDGLNDHYFKEHIPHRVNLLLTFRERFSSDSELKMDPEQVRDFYRCSKDISIFMVRFLLGEMGVTLKEKNIDLSETGNNTHVKRISIREIYNHPDYDKILKVLKAANRAIAHLEEKDVNHDMIAHKDTLRILIPAINYTEQKIISNIYLTEEAYKDAMSLKDNKMNRKEIKIV